MNTHASHIVSTINSFKVLGFRIDPSELLHDVYKELTSLFMLYSESPIFGVEYDTKQTVRQKKSTCDDKMKLFPLLQNEKEDLLRIEEITEIDNVASSEINSKFTSYLNQGDSNGKHREPFYCKELGFAMEKLRDGYSVKDLWNVIGAKGNP